MTTAKEKGAATNNAQSNTVTSSAIDHLTNTERSQDMLNIPESNVNLDSLLTGESHAWYHNEGADLVIRLAKGKMLHIDHTHQDLYYVTDEGVRNLDTRGQWTRAARLMDLMMYPDDNRGTVLKVAHSIIQQNMVTLDIDVYLNEALKNVPWHLRETEGNYITFMNRSATVRRDCAAISLGPDVRVIKIMDKNKLSPDQEEAVLLRAMEQMDDIHQIQELGGFAIKEDTNLRDEIIEKIFPDLLDDGFQFIGGNPDAGLLVFMRNPNIKVAENGQKLAKLILRGGIHLSEGDAFTATLATMEDDIEKDGYRDGVVGVVKRGIMSQWARRNGFFNGVVWQITMFKRDVVGAKGLLLSANKDMKESMDLLGSNDAIIDTKTWNSMYGTELVDGDEVTVTPDMLWVMGVSGEKGARTRNLHISGQMIRRGPEAIKKWLNFENKKALASRIRAARSNDKTALLPYLPKFGQYAKISEAGMKPMLQRPFYSEEVKAQAEKDGIELPEFRVDPYLAQVLEGDICRGNRNGYTVKGHVEYWVHDSSVEFDTGDQVPGIAVPESWGYKVGDRVVVVRYPVLPAKDVRDRSTGITVCNVVRVNKTEMVNVHPLTAKYMLGDEDGDQPIILSVPDHVPSFGLAHLTLTARKESSTKGKLFKAPLDGSIAENSEACLRVFMRLGTDVGIVDNRVSAIDLYLNYEPVTPTGETSSVYMSVCDQYSIESKKHQVNDTYSFDNLNAWAREILPGAFDDKGKFKKHPELIVQKTRDASGTFKHVTLRHYRAAFEEAGDFTGSEWTDFMRLSLNWELTEDGFVRPDHYSAAGIKLYKEIKELVTNQDTRLNIGELARDIFDHSIRLRTVKDWDASKHYLKVTGMEMAMTMPRAEYLLLQAQMFFITKKGSPITYLNFCSIDFLKLMAQYAEEFDPDTRGMFKLTNRNKTSQAREYHAPESGVKTVRAYVNAPLKASDILNEGDKIALMGEAGGIVVGDGNTFGVAEKDQMIGSFTITHVEEYGGAGRSRILYLS